MTTGTPSAPAGDDLIECGNARVSLKCSPETIKMFVERQIKYRDDEITRLRTELAEAKRKHAVTERDACMWAERAEAAERVLAEALAQRDQAIINFDNLAASFQKAEAARDRFAAEIELLVGDLEKAIPHETILRWHHDRAIRAKEEEKNHG